MTPTQQGPPDLSYLLSLTRFPQMTVNESAIARAWLVKHGREYERIEFNPLLGHTPVLGPEFDEVTRRQAAALMQKRSDILAWRGSEVTIVEVKPRLSFSALGQLLGYQILVRDAFPELATVHLVAIGHSASIDTPEVLMAYGVSVELFPDVTLIGQGIGQS